MNEKSGDGGVRDGGLNEPLVSLQPGIQGVRARVGGRDAIVTSKGEKGVLVYGPYERRDPGRYSVEFEIGTSGETAVLGDPVCLTLDVATNNGQTILAERRMLYSYITDEFETFSLDFSLHEPRTLEYRVNSSGQIGLKVARLVRVIKISDSTLPLTTADGRKRRWKNEREFLDGYLRNVTGLIHVGANVGQERRYYWLLGLNVVWVEPIREYYERLVDNIASYDRQWPVNALLADEDGKEFDFQIANNNGASSSLLPMEDHAKLWPSIQYVEKRKMTSITLESLMRREGITNKSYQALTLDVEGAELLVLKGAGNLLGQFEYVKCEVADFPARTGTPTAADLDAFLGGVGFRQIMRRAFSMGPTGEGTFWDIVWKRAAPGEPLNEPGVTLPLVAHPQDVEGIEKCE